MNLLWTGAALADRRAIRDYIAERNPGAALALDELVSERSSQLSSHPAMGRPGRVVGTRELVLHPNYILIYDVTADSVRVLRILHAARQWPPRDGA
ncbi:type II toxin-antitoxin system RelE/ParE family toxin [Novosphingobium sp.]|uniref:type II toxin-antitoxin system RelE/ParE family toxin n=1 Tax=Novosphingobium sp. TaxID=1874826 RepID=UPI003BA995D1